MEMISACVRKSMVSGAAADIQDPATEGRSID